MWCNCVDIKRNLCVGEDDAHKQVQFPQIQIAFDKDGEVEKERKKNAAAREEERKWRQKAI